MKASGNRPRPKSAAVHKFADGQLKLSGIPSRVTASLSSSAQLYSELTCNLSERVNCHALTVTLNGNQQDAAVL
jgi:hypothetical protein